MADEKPSSARWTEVVRESHGKTLGLVAATSGDCLKIQRDELRLVTGRAFRPMRPDALEGLALGPSWFLGILLCPGDSIADFVAWAKSIPKGDLWRIRIYYVAPLGIHDAMAPWTIAGLPEPPRFKVVDFRSFHRLFGRHHADVVHRDATRARLP